MLQKERGVSFMKRIRVSAVLLSAVLIVLLASVAKSERRIDGKGNYVYDYDQSVYDEIIFGNRTYGEFLKGHGNSSYDFDRFVNSEYGEIYAKYAALSVKYRDNMDEGLLEYWLENGMQKILVHPDNAQDTMGDYYVYVPIDAAKDERFPLVIVNHGSNSNARVCESFGWIELAGQNRFMLAMSENTDPEFLHEMLMEIKANYSVDEHRVYMTGTSNGGRCSKQFACRYPDEVAAIAPMNVTFALNEEDGNASVLKEKGMPMLFVAGTADAFNPLPVRNGDNILMASIDGWNRLIALHGFEQYHITAEESAQLLETSINLLEHYTGLRLPEAKVYNAVNNRTFQCDFVNAEGVTTLSLIIEENGSHEPLGYDAELAWNFMKQFTR